MIMMIFFKTLIKLWEFSTVTNIIFPENNVCQRQLDLLRHFHFWEIWNPESYKYVGKRSSTDKF